MVHNQLPPTGTYFKNNPVPKRKKFIGVKSRQEIEKICGDIEKNGISMQEVVDISKWIASLKNRIPESVKTSDVNFLRLAILQVISTFSVYIPLLNVYWLASNCLYSQTGSLSHYGPLQYQKQDFTTLQL